MTLAEAGAGRRSIETRMFQTSRWDHVKLRDDDIIVATWAKSGTTLTQQMVFQLISGGAEGVAAFEGSPWIDVRFLMPLDVMVGMLEAQTERRVLKTHLPFEATPYNPAMKYVYIGRDGRDVLWSLYDHMSAFTPAAWAAVNAEGPWPTWSPTSLDVREYYLHWLETDTTPGFHDLSFWQCVQSWWDERQRPNVMLLHYANVIADLPGQLRQLAAFLGIEIDEARFPTMVEHCSMAYMRKAGEGAPLEAFFADGAKSFINKGVNGRWRDLLSPAEIARCDEIAATKLTPDCAHWLKTGELAG